MARTPPQGESRALDSSITLATLARELAKRDNLCLPACARREVRWIELVAAPYGYDVVFVSKTARCKSGDVYLQHRQMALA